MPTSSAASAAPATDTRREGERLETERARDTAAGSNGVLWCAPSQACICQTTRSDSYEQVNQMGTSWGKALAHPVWQFHGYLVQILLGSAPKRAFSQPRQRKASQHTPRRPPRPCVASPPPRARPSGGRSAAIPPQHGRARAGSKLPGGPQRGAAHRR